MNQPVMDFLCAGDPAFPLQVLVEGRDLRFAPLERSLLSQLARADGLPVRRDTLLEALVLAPQSLYRLIYSLRKKLGEHREKLEQIGSCTTRGGRTFGFSGYRLTGFVFRWHNAGSEAC